MCELQDKDPLSSIFRLKDQLAPLVTPGSFEFFQNGLLFNFSMESLILAQDERWRRGLGMQVERRTFGLRSGERVSNT